MKLTVWQQFSSNHSGSFSLIGRFASQEEAAKAYERLYAFLKEFADWVNAYEGNIRHDGVYERENYTPPEIKFYEKHELKPFYNAVEWMITISKNLDNGINQFDNLLIMQSVSDWANNGFPWDELLEKWGAKVFVGREQPGNLLLATIRCDANDEAHAERLHHDLSAIYSFSQLPPWAWYFDGQKQEMLENLDRRQIRELLFYQRNLPSHIKREGKTVIVDPVLFHSWTRGFPAVIAWLRSQECVVEYKFLIDYEEVESD